MHEAWVLPLAEREEEGEEEGRVDGKGPETMRSLDSSDEADLG